MPTEKRPSPKTFRFNEPEAARLARLAERLDTSEAQAVYCAIAALEGLLEHGLRNWTREGSDGKQVIHLLRPGARTLMLVEDGHGGFKPWTIGEAEWTGADDE
ncbi:MAG: hypothetical protein RB191_13370 [Terriglobia bacterium]|nr:hypothetical protein [Terriglobia bacterium]